MQEISKNSQLSHSLEDAGVSNIINSLEYRRAGIQSLREKHKLDAIFLFSTREDSIWSNCAIGTPCKSDVHYVFFDQNGSGIMEMPWRIPGLLPRLTTTEEMVPVAGEGKMRAAISERIKDKGYGRVGIIGNVPYLHLSGIDVEIINLTKEAAELSKGQNAGVSAMTVNSSANIKILKENPLSEQDRLIYEDRLKALQVILKENNVDILLLSGTDKKCPYLRWLCGVGSLSANHYLIIKPDEVDMLEVDHGNEDLSNYMPFRLKVTQVANDLELATQLEKAVSGTKRIGIGHEVPYSGIIQLASAYEITNLSTELEAMMSIKSPQEIAILREAAQDLTTFLEDELARIKRGMTGKELEESIDKQIALHKGSSSFPTGVAVDQDLSGEAPTTLAEPLSSQVIEESVCVDMGIQRCWLLTDITRMGFTSDCLLSEGYENLKAAQDQTISQIKPGMTVGALTSIVKEALEANNIDPNTLIVDELGHGVGLGLHEPPFLSEGEEDAQVLLPGMVICVEPDVALSNGTRFRIEDMVLITEDGAEKMTVRRK